MPRVAKVDDFYLSLAVKTRRCSKTAAEEIEAALKIRSLGIPKYFELLSCFCMWKKNYSRKQICFLLGFFWRRIVLVDIIIHLFIKQSLIL